MSAPTPPPRPLRSPNYTAIGEAMIGPPKGFKAAGVPEERRFNDARFVAKVQNFTKPLRRIGAGVLITGVERRLVFVGGVPPGVLLPPYVLSADFEPGWHGAGLAFTDGVLYRFDSRLSGWPPEGEPLSGYISSRDVVRATESWAAVAWALGLGFEVADLASFAGAAGCLDVLREGAHHAIVEHLGLLHPRARLDLFKRATGTRERPVDDDRKRVALDPLLPGFTKADAGGPYAPELFHEALLAAVTAADVPGLVALVAALVGEGSETAGGAA
jgi:hypothetical protein